MNQDGTQNLYQTYKYQWWLLLALLLVGRLSLSHILPLMDFSEARYAEMARKILALNDWTTIWYSWDLPFWGKPPAAFWSVAISFSLFGINEIASRLPSLLFTLGTTALLYWWVKKRFNPDTALLATMVYATSLIVVHTAGAVITDPLLTLATTIVMVAFWEALQNKENHLRWAYLMWAALALGLMSKGPLALVLAGSACGLWVMILNRWQLWFSRTRLFTGLTLMLLIAAPWYYLAEQKTPGFIDYFIVGEHFKRFTESAWSGDLYGGVKDQPLGAIWVYLIAALMPWSLILLLRLLTKNSRAAIKAQFQASREITLYLWLWALCTLVFFTFSKNILITYVLPALPAWSVLIALHFKQWILPKRWAVHFAIAWVVAQFALLFTAYYGHFQYHRYNQKPLVMKYLELNEIDPGKLVYFGAHRFSPVFYTQENVEFGRNPFQHLNEDTVYFAVRDMWRNSAESTPRFISRCTEQFYQSEFSLWYCPAQKQ